MRTGPASHVARSLARFVLLECALSVPFWAVGALAQAHVIPDHVLFRASWSLTPMMAAVILVHRETGSAGVRLLLRRIVDYPRITSRVWYLPVLLAGPVIAGLQYGVALWFGMPVAPPRLTLLVPLSLVGFFLVAYTEELGWTVYVLDTLQERWSAFTAGIVTGIIWASVHTPVWALAGQPLDWCVWQWIYVVALRVLMTWVYNNAGQSLFAMDLLHPGLFVWWYLWPVSGTGLSMPAVYDPRTLALIATALAASVTYLWGPKTLARYRYLASEGQSSQTKAVRVSMPVNWRRYAASCGLLTVPILIWNVVCARYLPAPYASPGFERGVPPALLLSENLLRVAVIALPFFMPLDVSTASQRRRLALFVSGVVIYFASWVPLMVAPLSAWSTSLVGGLAPAYTPLAWLVGLGLLGGRDAGPWLLRRGVYLLLAIVFVTVHVAHVGVVYASSGDGALGRGRPPAFESAVDASRLVALRQTVTGLMSTHRPRAYLLRYVCEFQCSMVRSLTLSNSATLLVTSVRPNARGCAAMKGRSPPSSYRAASDRRGARRSAGPRPRRTRQTPRRGETRQAPRRPVHVEATTPHRTAVRPS